MKCHCSALRDVEKIDTYRNHFQSMAQLEIGNWKRLVKCQSCNQYWAIDESDGRNTIFATKVSNALNWQDVNVTGQKMHLLQARGGLEDAPCAHAGCKQSRVKNVMFCVDHLYQMGWRE